MSHSLKASTGSQYVAQSLTLAHVSLNTNQSSILKDSGTSLCDMHQVFSHFVPSAQNDCSCSLSLLGIFLHVILRTKGNVTS